MVMKSHNPGLVVALLLVLLCASAAAIAAVPDQPGVLMSAEERLQKKITLTTRPDAPIAAVIAQLADQAGVSIVTSPSVTGNVPAMRVKDVPLGELLNNILAAYGYTYIATENMVRVVPLTEVEIAKEKLVTRIYRITYSDVVEVARALEKFKSKRGEIAFNKATSNIIMTDTESKIKAISDFIIEIDRITPQILVEVRIYDITTNETFDLDIEWIAGRNTPFTTVDRTRTHTEDTGGATQVDVDVSGDVPIVTETQVAETRDVDTVIKTDKSWLLGEGGEHLPFTRRSKPFVGGQFKPGQGGAVKFGIMNDAVDIELVLSILHSELEARLLANPRVLVLDNETANFKIVREIPYSEQITTASTALQQTKFKDVGVELNVTPHITRAGMLRLYIAPKFGIQVGTSPLGAPIVDNREAETTLLVKDGQTVVLGGLRKKEISKGIDKVPVLGDMPLLGGLFRSESEMEVINELVVFITTTIVTEPVLTETELKQLEETNLPAPAAVPPTKTR